jgi:hypothetical protein
VIRIWLKGSTRGFMGQRTWGKSGYLCRWCGLDLGQPTPPGDASRIQVLKMGLLDTGMNQKSKGSCRGVGAAKPKALWPFALTQIHASTQQRPEN